MPLQMRRYEIDPNPVDDWLAFFVKASPERAEMFAGQPHFALALHVSEVEAIGPDFDPT
jgi:hypothetical protein